MSKNVAWTKNIKWTPKRTIKLVCKSKSFEDASEYMKTAKTETRMAMQGIKKLKLLVLKNMMITKDSFRVKRTKNIFLTIFYFMKLGAKNKRIKNTANKLNTKIYVSSLFWTCASICLLSYSKYDSGKRKIKWEKNVNKVFLMNLFLRVYDPKVDC